MQRYDGPAAPTDSTVPVKCGVLLIALRNSYYMNMAINLALSIKAHDRETPITLITDLSMPSDIYRLYFDKIMKIQVDNPFMLKTGLYNLTPYKRTLYLDVDMIVNPAKSLTEITDSLTGAPFRMASRGPITDKYDWGQPVQGLNVSSEVIYWEQGETAEAIYKTAQDFYLTGQISHRLGGFQPDEPSFTHAIRECKYAHPEHWLPSFWLSHHQNSFVSNMDIQNRYNFVSMGGAAMDQRIVKLYTRYAQIAANKLGVRPTQFFQKRQLVKERNMI